MCNYFMEEITKILNNDKINDLYDDMSKYQKDLFNSFKDDPNKFSDYSLNDLIYDFDKYFIEAILEIEIDLYLEEEKKLGNENKRNGYTKDISLTIEDKIIHFNRPRLRYENDFDSKLIPKRTRIMKDLTHNIVLLYSKNNSINDIKEILKEMFNINISTAFISKLIQSISEDIYEWRNRELNPCYFALNIDCTYISIKDEKHLKSHKIPIYIAIGTTLQGYKEVIGMYLGNEDENHNVIDSLYDEDISESKSFWLNVFNDLKERGLKKVLYISSDGVTGIKEAINEEFPGAFYQRCVVHIDRNLAKYAGKKERNNVLKDFKQIYNAPSYEIAELKANEFLEKYKDKKTIIKHASSYIDEVMPLFNVPIHIRKYIYTNNIVESANSKIKRGFYGRGALPNIQAAINIIYLNLIELEKKWSKKKVTNWKNIYSEIIQIYYEEIKEYL